MVAFLVARYAEDWSAARDRELALGLNESRATRDIDAKREIITITFRCAETIDGEWGCGHRAGEIAASLCEYIERDDPGVLGIIHHLTTVYSDHPDYRPEWVPSPPHAS